MIENSKSTDQITFIDVIVFFIKNRKLLLISFIIGIVLAGSFYFIFSTKHSDKQDTSEVYAEMEFIYHEPWNEISFLIESPKEYLKELRYDQEFIKKVVETALTRMKIEDVTVQEVDDIAEGIVKEKLITYRFSAKIKDTDQDYKVFIKLDNFTLPLNISFTDFSSPFLNTFYTDVFEYVLKQLEYDAVKIVDEAFLYYKNLDEPSRELELDNLKIQIYQARQYINHTIMPFRGKKIVSVYGPIYDSNNLLIIKLALIILLTTAVPIFIKYSYLSLKKIKSTLAFKINN